MKKGEDREILRLLPKRERNSHKGSYGRAAIVAGSIDYLGAGYLATAACLKSGSGYTFLFTPAELLPCYALKAPEAILRGICEGARYRFDEEKMQTLLGFDSVAYGMGMGQSEEVFLGGKWLLERYEGKLLLDADGLNSLSLHKEELPALFANKKCEVVLTPHVKELARLLGTEVQRVIEGGMELVEKCAKDWGVTLLCKSAYSLLSNGGQSAVNRTGNSGQAKGGSGDVLSGVIAGLLAQGATPFDGARVGAYLVGRAAELGVKEVGEYSLTASDLIENIGRAFLSLR